MWIKILVVLLLLASDVYAATYYVDAAAANDAGSGAIGSPKKYIPSGVALMSSSGGDTVIIKDGTYAGASNNISTWKAGTSGNWNTVRAENDGGVIVTSDYQTESATNVYTNVIGIKFKSSISKYFYQQYIKYFRCAFEGGQVCTSSCNGAINFEPGNYTLIEDCWFYGVGGRYTIMIWEHHDVVLRRVVIRHDGGYSAGEDNPEAPLVNYASYNTSFQNVIIIDSISTDTNGGYDDYVCSFYTTGHDYNTYSSNNVAMIGGILLNNIKAGIQNDTDDGGVGYTVEDTVAYGGMTADIIGTSNQSMNMTFNRITAGGTTDRYVWESGERTITIGNSVFFDSDVSSVLGSTTTTYTNGYNQNDFTGTGVTHINPETNGLLYLPRIEDASTLKTGGSSGGQRGAQVVNKIGVSGTLYGESGYNTVTADALWPWPNEDRIKTDMASIPSIGARGFATGNSLDATPQTLTKYIWEALGNQIPAEIYGGSGSGSGGMTNLGGGGVGIGGGSFR